MLKKCSHQIVTYRRSRHELSTSFFDDMDAFVLLLESPVFASNLSFVFAVTSSDILRLADAIVELQGQSFSVQNSSSDFDDPSAR